jgi:DNA-binding beta-propeller fold protein YncE
MGNGMGSMKLMLAVVALSLAWTWQPVRAADCAVPAGSAELDVPGAPFAVVATPDRCWAFVSLSTGKGAGSLAVIHNDGAHWALARTQKLSGAAFGESISTDGATMVVATDHGVDVLDMGRLKSPSDNALLGTLSEGDDAGYIDALMTRDGQAVLVTEEQRQRIAVFNLAKAEAQQFQGNVLVGHIPSGIAPTGVALSNDGAAIYAVSEVTPVGPNMPASCAPEDRTLKQHPPGLLMKIDPQKAVDDPAKAIVTVVPAGCNPVRVAASPDGKYIWVTARGDNALVRFNADELRADNKTLHTSKYPGGSSPIGLSTNGNEVWLASSDRFQKTRQSGLVGMILSDGEPKTRMEVALPGFPRDVAMLKDAHMVIVTLFSSRKVAMIATDTKP